MGDATLLRRGERVGDVDADPQQAIERDTATRNRLTKRPAVHELHRQEQPSAVFLDGMDRDDAGMIEGGDGLRLALETLPRGRIAREHAG